MIKKMKNSTTNMSIKSENNKKTTDIVIYTAETVLITIEELKNYLENVLNNNNNNNNMKEVKINIPDGKFVEVTIK